MMTQSGVMVEKTPRNKLDGLFVIRCIIGMNGHGIIIVITGDNHAARDWARSQLCQCCKVDVVISITVDNYGAWASTSVVLCWPQMLDVDTGELVGAMGWDG
jgi:hypothetical protein